jgi:hypothetical protein
LLNNNKINQQISLRKPKGQSGMNNPKTLTGSLYEHYDGYLVLFFVGRALLLFFLVICVVSFIFVVFLLGLVPNIACVSGLFIPDCPFGFLNDIC